MMEQPNSLNQQTESTGNPDNRTRNIVIGCGIIALVFVCACALLGSATIGLFSYFGREPEGLAMQIEYPWTVQVNESFELIMTLRNSGDSTITIQEIDLDEALGGSILDGSVVERTDPPMEKDYSIPGIKSFLFNQSIGPGETQEIVFYLRAIEAGDFGGTVGAYLPGGQAVRQDTSISVLP